MALRDRKNNKLPEEKTIEINAQMQGTLSFNDPVNLKINGLFNGTLDTRGTLTIGEMASVEANINGENIVVAGRVKGNIIATKMLVLMPTATLNGDITTPRLNIVEGAIFQGKCQMNSDNVFNIDEVAEYLEIDTKSVMELVNNGKMPAMKTGDSWTFEREKIDDWAATTKVK